MAREKEVTSEAVLELAKKLSPADKLKLVQHLLVELEPIVDKEEPKKWRSSQGAPTGERRPMRVVQLEGLWKDIPFDVSTADVRQARRELSEALKRRVERH